jgi:sugar O-acyltransferase (sialic acid O-acetyltransferase NeuD family)
LSKPVLVLGAGGHAAVIVDILRQLQVEILGIVATNQPKDTLVFDGIPYFSKDDDVLRFSKDKILLVNGIGSMPGSNIRSALHEFFKQAGYNFMTIVAPSATVSNYTILAEGSQLLPGCIINTNAQIGVSTIVNTGAIIEHDCIIGNHNHVAPGVVLSGGVMTDEYVHIGTGAQVIQNIKIGAYTLIGAGASVTKNLDSNKTLYAAKPFLR